MSKCWNALRGPARFAPDGFSPGTPAWVVTRSSSTTRRLQTKQKRRRTTRRPSLPSSRSASRRMYSFPISTCRTISRCSRNWPECGTRFIRNCSCRRATPWCRSTSSRITPHYQRFMQSRYPELPERRAFFVAQPRSIGGAEDLLVYTFWGERIQQDLQPRTDARPVAQRHPRCAVVAR